MKLLVTEIIDIIKTCREYGVETVEWDGFKATFRAGRLEWRTPKNGSGKPEPEFQQDIEPKERETQEKLIKEQQVQELLIEDPETYETLMAQNQLVQEPDGPEI